MGVETGDINVVQVFYKSIEQTLCLKEAAEQLQALAATVRDGGDACQAIVVPHGFQAAKALFEDVRLLTFLLQCSVSI